MSTETMERPVVAAPVVALTPPQRAAVALNTAEYEIKLRELLTNSAGILTVQNKAGRDECHTAYMVLKNARCSITNLSEDATEDAKAFTKAVKAEAVRLIAITTAEEDRLEGLRDDWDEAEKARKAALIAAEKARVERIQHDIQSIRDLVAMAAGKPSSAIAEAIEILTAIQMTGGRFEEFAPAAIQAVAETGDKLGEMHEAALVSEAAAFAAEEARKAEAARIEAERAELAQLRAAAVETARLTAIENERIANEQAAERQRLANLAAAQEAEARRVREQAAENLRAEQDALAEQVRLQREIQEKNSMALSQIEAIRHQAVIAEVGRSPYVKGGDAASYLFVLAETRAWVIDDEQFGVMTASAQMVKDSTIVMLAQGLASYIAADHADALIDNEHFDIDREAERIRLQLLADQHLTDKRDLPPPESCCARDARINEGFDETPTDGEILDVYVENFGGTREQAIERLALFDAVLARADLVPA